MGCGIYARFLNTLRPADSDEELRNSAAGISSRVNRQDSLRRSTTNLRRQAEALNNNQRLQSNIGQAMEAFPPFPPGMSGSPLPSDYENNPLVGLPLDSTRARPTAPVILGEAARDSIGIPATPAQVIAFPRVHRNPNRFAFTPVPTTPQSEEPPNAPFRDNTRNTRTSSDDSPVPESITINRA